MTLEWTSTGSRLVYEEMTATITFKDNDVRAMYIDWDDGESNKKEEANYQWIQFTEPKKSTTATHIYTKADTFKPVIQTINSQGIASKYMSNQATNTDVTPHVYASGGAMENLVILDRDPTAVMRVENKTVNSGIDNSIFESEGALDLYIAMPPLVSATNLMDIDMKVAIQCMIEVDMVYASGSRGAFGFDPVHSPQVGVESIVHTIEATLTSLNTSSGLTLLNDEAGLFYKVKKVLEAKLVTVRKPSSITGYAREEAFNQIKFFIVAKGSDGNYYPITYITPGIPIKKANDRHRFITMDFSQSRASASNYTPSFYKYDLGKAWFSPYKQWESVISGTSLTFDATTSSSTAVHEVHYTYMPRPDGLMGNGTTIDANADFVIAFASGSNFKWYLDTDQEPRTDQFPLDDFNAFNEQYHLIRDTVDVTGSSKYSGLGYFDGGTFRISPAKEWTTGDQHALGGGGNSNSICKLYTAANTALLRGTGSVSVTSGTYDNDTSLLSGAVYMREWNIITYKGRMGNTRTASEYFLLAATDKHNKIFFNITPYAKDLQSDLAGFDNGTTIAGVYYLRVNKKGTNLQTVEWVPLEFEDTTAVTKEYRDTTNKKYVEKKESFAKSGYISFDMPDDWGSLSISGMIGNANLGEAESATPVSPVDVTNPYNISLVDWDCTETGNLASAAGVDGKFATFTGSSEALDSLTASDIGVMGYMAFITSGLTTDDDQLAGTNYWACSGLTDGFVYGTSGGSTHKIILHVGTKAFDNQAIIEYGKFDTTEAYGISLRPISIYDVFDGASKVWSSSPTEDVGNWDMDMVDAAASIGTEWPNRWCFPQTNVLLGDVSGSAWNSGDKYPLKIVVSGGHMPSSSGATGITGPEVWNILPFNDANSQIVKEIDDHAYSLNALPITSDIAVTRGGAYYQAITRKGKVFIIRTGDVMSTIGFSSVAMGDEGSSTAFADRGPTTEYGQLRRLRKAQAHNARVYWDEPQKDGTFVRFWGVVTEVSESHAAGGPQAIISYNANMSIEEIAIIDENGDMMTDIFPLGGIEDEKDFA